MFYHFLKTRNFPKQMHLFSKYKCFVCLETESFSLLRVALSLKTLQYAFLSRGNIFNFLFVCVLLCY